MVAHQLEVVADVLAGATAAPPPGVGVDAAGGSAFLTQLAASSVPCATVGLWRAYAGAGLGLGLGSGEANPNNP